MLGEAGRRVYADGDRPLPRDDAVAQPAVGGGLTVSRGREEGVGDGLALEAHVGALSEGRGAFSREAVEAALAAAITKAAEAGRFDVVARLVEELEARRRAPGPSKYTKR